MAEIEPNNFLCSGSNSYARTIAITSAFRQDIRDLNFSVAKMAVKTLHLLRGFGFQGGRQQKAIV